MHTGWSADIGTTWRLLANLILKEMKWNLGPKSEHGLSQVVGLKYVSADGHLYFFEPSAAIGWNLFQPDKLA